MFIKHYKYKSDTIINIMMYHLKAKIKCFGELL